MTMARLMHPCSETMKTTKVSVEVHLASVSETMRTTKVLVEVAPASMLTFLEAAQIVDPRKLFQMDPNDTTRALRALETTVE